jgi:AraC-like DNA-binding protein
MPSLGGRAIESYCSPPAAENGDQSQIPPVNKSSGRASVTARLGSASTSPDGFALVEPKKSSLHALDDLNDAPQNTQRAIASFEEASALIRLAKAGCEPGLESEKIACHAKDILRLAIAVCLSDPRIAPPKACEEKRAAPPMQKWRLSRVLRHVDASISDRLSLSDLAAVAGISRMYFAGQFRAATGMRPHDYVQRRRIEHAQQLLLSSDLGLTEIAQSVGFQTQSHFTTTFKRFVYSTPYRWRQNKNER